MYLSFPGGAVVKNMPANAEDSGDMSSISGSGRPPRWRNGNPLQYSCLENSMEKAAWWATVYRVTKSQTLLSMHICIGLSAYFLPDLLWKDPFPLFNRKVKVKLLSHVRLFVTLWTGVYQAPPSMGFSRQEYWSGLPFPSPGDLPDSGIKPRSPSLEEDTFNLWAPRVPWNTSKLLEAFVVENKAGGELSRSWLSV